MLYKIYLCHNIKDEKIALELKDILEQKVRCSVILFRDYRIIGKSRISTSIEIIESATYYLPLITENFINSNENIWELKMALAKELMGSNLIIIPIKVESVIVPSFLADRIPFHLKEGVINTDFNSLIKAIKTLNLKGDIFAKNNTPGSYLISQHDSIENDFYRAKRLKLEDNTNWSFKEFKKIFNNLEVKLEKGYRSDIELELITEIVLDFADLQMQRGISNGVYSMQRLIILGLEIAMSINSLKYILKSYQLLGLYYRQQDMYYEAILSYNKALKVAQVLKNSDNLINHIKHDISVSAFLHASEKNDSVFYDLSSTLGISSLTYFQNNNPCFGEIINIRLGEMYVKKGNFDSAQKILSEYESIKFSTLSKPFRTLFMRINAEKYFSLGNYDKGLSWMRFAEKLNQQENYQHQMREISKINRKFQINKKFS